MCAKCAKQISALVAFACFSLLQSVFPHQKASPIHLFPLILDINLFPEDGETNLAAAPQYHLPWGIEGWLSCYCLSQWDYLLPTVAHYDTCFHNLTHTLSHSSSVYLPISPFHFHMRPDLPRYSRKGTLYWRAAEFQEFFEHFHWLRAIVLPAC